MHTFKTMPTGADLVEKALTFNRDYYAGELESLKSDVRKLAEIVGNMLDNLELTDQQKLELVGLQYSFTIEK